MSSDALLAINAVIEPINKGMLLDKCRKCGCMQLALDATRQAFASNHSDDAKVLLQRISELQEQMEPTGRIPTRLRGRKPLLLQPLSSNWG